MLGHTPRGPIAAFAATAILAIAGFATYSAYTATTSNEGSTFTAGTVALNDNAGTSPLFDFSALKPGDTAERCVVVTYTGTLPAQVRFYVDRTPAAEGDLSPYITTTVTRGQSTSSDGTCSDFTPDGGGGEVFSGKLAGLPTSWDAGLVDPDASWAQSERTTYRITVAQDDANDAQGRGVTVGFTWEARNL